YLAAPARWQVWLQRIVLALACVGLLCFAYGYFIEPYRLEVTHVRIESAKLPKGTRPIRLVQISDLHSDPKVRLEERLPEVVAAEQPDLIVFTGDAINTPAGLPIFKRCLTRLAQIAPTFAVQGNWDVWNWTDLDRFAGTGARELKGEAVKFDVAGRYCVKQTWLYVNRGIGMEGGPAPRVRFWARPEVTVIEIAPAS